MESLFLVSLALVFLTCQGRETCCPDGWIPYRGFCYRFYGETRMDWNEAIQYCKLKSANLTDIETHAESNSLKAYARKLYSADSYRRNTTVFWLGASDREIEGIWKWVDKDEVLPYKEGVFNNSPDNHEDCLALNGVYDFNWQDGICRERVGFPLCKMPETKTKGSCCPDGLLPFHNSCYLFSNEVRMSWVEAAAFCKHGLQNGHLVEINTKHENLFLKWYLQTLYPIDHKRRNITLFWTGGTDTDIEGIWKWIGSDEELTFTDWPRDSTQPDMTPGNHEDCLGLNGGYNFEWHDGLCTERIGYPACEKK